MQTSDSLRGKVRYNQRLQKYCWSVRDAEGNLMAAGEEFKLHHAFQNAHDTVFAVQAWVMFGLGVIKPGPRLNFKYKPGRKLFRL